MLAIIVMEYIWSSPAGNTIKNTMKVIRIQLKGVRPEKKINSVKIYLKQK